MKPPEHIDSEVWKTAAGKNTLDNTAYAFAVVDGIAAERVRIRARIEARIADLRTCHKNDECKMLADYIEGYLPEWVWE